VVERSSTKGRRFPIEVLSAREVLALMAACSARAPTGVRNRALIAVLWRAGLRISEALALAVKDLDREAGALTVLHGKGDRRRVVGLDPTAMAVLERWLELRAKRVRRARAAPVFCTLEGKRLQAQYVRALLPRLAEKAGIDKRVHAHGLRHAHASELVMEGTPLSIVQAQLGHASLAATERYVRHLAPADLVRALQERAWPAGG
jgi:site-specific recombinase XerD